MLNRKIYHRTFFILFALLCTSASSKKCGKNCKNCIGDFSRTSATKCTECFTSFHISEGECYPCIKNCRTCTTSKNCTVCNNFRFYQYGECRISIASILLHITAVVIIVVSIWLLLANWKKLQDIKGEMVVEAEIQKIDKDLNNNTLDDSVLSKHSSFDASGLDYMEDVDDEGNLVREGKKGYYVL